MPLIEDADQLPAVVADGDLVALPLHPRHDVADAAPAVRGLWRFRKSLYLTRSYSALPR